MRVMSPEYLKYTALTEDKELVGLGRELWQGGLNLRDAIAEAKARLMSDHGYLERRINQLEEAIGFLERRIEESKVCHRSLSSRVWTRRLEKVQTEKKCLEKRLRALTGGRK